MLAFTEGANVWARDREGRAEGVNENILNP